MPNGTRRKTNNESAAASRATGPAWAAVRIFALLHAAMLMTAAVGPVEAQSNQSRARANTPSGPAAGERREEVDANLASMTPEQEASLRAAIAARRADRQTGRDVAEAAPLIERLVRTSACGRNNGAWAALNRDAVQPLVEPLFAPLKTSVARFNDGYHDDRHCYDVIRLTDVSKPAANALRFSAYMVSPDSQKATTRMFELLRVDGRWLIRSAN